VLGINFGQLGVPIGYHRLLTHRSFQAHHLAGTIFGVLPSRPIQADGSS